MTNYAICSYAVENSRQNHHKKTFLALVMLWSIFCRQLNNSKFFFFEPHSVLPRLDFKFPGRSLKKCRFKILSHEKIVHIVSSKEGIWNIFEFQKADKFMYVYFLWYWYGCCLAIQITFRHLIMQSKNEDF